MAAGHCNAGILHKVFAKPVRGITIDVFKELLDLEIRFAERGRSHHKRDFQILWVWQTASKCLADFLGVKLQRVSKTSSYTSYSVAFVDLKLEFAVFSAKSELAVFARQDIALM